MLIELNKPDSPKLENKKTKLNVLTKQKTEIRTTTQNPFDDDSPTLFAEIPKSN
jgi:hypothetical protein